MMEREPAAPRRLTPFAYDGEEAARAYGQDRDPAACPHIETKASFYSRAYGPLWDAVHAQIRIETYGEDIGQNSWLTSAELADFVRRLDLSVGHRMLDLGSGSGGPALYLAREFGFRVIGVDLSPEGVKTAIAVSRAAGLQDLVAFQVADMRQGLPFGSADFDAVLCIDSINHLGERTPVLKEWQRILRPGGRVIYTDPVVLTGLVAREELDERSMSGPFVFVPPGANEQFIADAGLELIECLDTTAGTEAVARRWYEARRQRQAALIDVEGEAFATQRTQYFGLCHRLYAERRLARIAFIARRPISRGPLGC